MDMSFSRRNFLSNMGALAAASIGTSAYALEQSSHFDQLKVTYHPIPTDKVPVGFDLVGAFLSDLHVGCPSVSLDVMRAAVNQVNHLTLDQDGQQRGMDIILLGGDYLINKHYDPRTEFLKPEKVVPVLRDLQAPLGVHGVLGNHDWHRMSRHGNFAAMDKNMWSIFADNGIQIMENDVTTLSHRDMEFDLIGLPDHLTRRATLTPAMQQNLFKDVANRPSIILSHDPKTFEIMPAEAVVQFSGHTHGGQFVIPVIKQPIYMPTPGTPFHYAYGHIIENGRDLVVTSGMGTSTVSAKNTDNEVVVFRIYNPGMAA